MSGSIRAEAVYTERSTSIICEYGADTHLRNVKRKISAALRNHLKKEFGLDLTNNGDIKFLESFPPSVTADDGKPVRTLCTDSPNLTLTYGPTLVGDTPLKQVFSSTLEEVMGRLNNIEAELKTEREGRLAEAQQFREKFRHQEEAIQDLTRLILPVHTRSLLDKARDQFVTACSPTPTSQSASERWKNFNHGHSSEQVISKICKELPEMSRATVEMVCSGKLHEDGNRAAHAITEAEAQKAVTTYHGATRTQLEEVYMFVYGKPVGF